MAIEQMANEISPPELARLAVEAFVRSEEIIEPPRALLGLETNRAGAFVTLRTTGGQLRGCIGTVEPVCENVAQEIIHNAISAALRDPRFPPVAVNELGELTYGVDVLSQPEPARGPQDLDPSHYGVIIETLDKQKRGLLLPRIEGIETVEQQWEAVHRKAGVRPGTEVRVERFTVMRFGKQ